MRINVFVIGSSEDLSTKKAIFEQTYEGGQRVRTLSGVRASRQRDY